MIKKRYTISKIVAEDLQFKGWTLIETFYDKEYSSDIYHLEKEEPDGPEEEQNSEKG